MPNYIMTLIVGHDVCMYVCPYVHKYVCMDIYMYVCMYACMYVCNPLAENDPGCPASEFQ